jgi:hypothetical protein
MFPNGKTPFERIDQRFIKSLPFRPLTTNHPFLKNRFYQTLRHIKNSRSIADWHYSSAKPPAN